MARPYQCSSVHSGAQLCKWMEKYTRCVCVCVNVYKINDPIAEENFTQYPITENAGIIPERQLNLDRCIQSEQAWWQIQLLLI